MVSIFLITLKVVIELLTDLSIFFSWNQDKMGIYNEVLKIYKT